MGFLMHFNLDFYKLASLHYTIHYSITLYISVSSLSNDVIQGVNTPVK